MLQEKYFLFEEIKKTPFLCITLDLLVCLQIINVLSVDICAGAHLCLYVGRPHSQKYTPYKESHGDMDKNSISFI